MTEKELFSLAGARPAASPQPAKKKRFPKGMPFVSISVLGLLVLGCLFAEFVMTKDPTYLDLHHSGMAPNGEFLFGTDTLGRDIFSCIWYGGRVSLFVGFFATLISTVIAVVYGSASGIAPWWLDGLFMRATEILLSVPGLLVILFLQGIFGTPNPTSIAVVIGITSWFSISKIIRTEVRQLRRTEYVLAAKAMGGGFFHVLRKHLAPNFVSSVMFMVVMNIRTAIVVESTLSFLGMGLPVEVISWGSMLSLSEKAVLSGSWWMIVIPGAFLVGLVLCITNIGNWLRRQVNHQESKL